MESIIDNYINTDRKKAGGYSGVFKMNSKEKKRQADKKQNSAEKGKRKAGGASGGAKTKSNEEQRQADKKQNSAEKGAPTAKK
ncbi:hypothetical protein OSTOST_22112 [Ostertagia ostertagi]